jgi:hypothetical protein
MKFATAVFLLISLAALPVFSYAQENVSAASGPAIGLPSGQKIPAFTAQDQFGHEQSNETLKGPNGTVLLFFRSADW